ncbi:helix-turn-helix domain-containing protein [Pseudomonas monteilii]|uniref:helix-turn-helix domain-containing protein n=1 Tax=Pseudomonas monteilii TaxID=76759 RepID=UPI003F6DF163
MATTPGALPDAAHYSDSPGYLRKLYEASGLSQRECARRLGVTHSTLKSWLAGSARWPYTAQYALERLATGTPGGDVQQDGDSNP